jgi:hypothetical protein
MVSRRSLTVDDGNRLEVYKLIKPAEHMQWQRSSYCGTNACVEVATLDGTYFVRDAKDPGGAVISLSAAQWAVFRSAVNAGDFDI